MIILSIESSTTVCSVALHQNGQLLALTELFGEKSHATFLTLIIEDLVKKNKLQLSDIQAVAVSEGPGSYTGLRIGVSVAKGLCYALQIPLLAVDTLQVMAAQLADFEPNAWLCPMLDARRMEVYTAIFQKTKKIYPTKALVLDQNSFSEFLENQKIYFFGDGSGKFEKICSHTNAFFVENCYPSAKFVGKLAFQNPKEVDLAYFEPHYLKEFQGVAAKNLLKV